MKLAIFEKNDLPEICEKENINFLGVFGSYAKGKATKKSDIDLLVRFSTRKSLLDMVRIERKLSEKLGKKVDLLTEMAISPYLLDRIKKEVKVVYER